VFCG